MKVQSINMSAIAHGSVVTFAGLELKGLTKVGSHEGAVTPRLEKLAAAGKDDEAEPLMYHNYSIGGRVFTVDSRRQADIDLLDAFLGIDQEQGAVKPKLAEVQLIANDYTRKKRNELGVETDETELATSWKLDYVVTHADAIAMATEERELNKARGIIGSAVAAAVSPTDIAALRADIAKLSVKPEPAEVNN